jgi:hypothetical protein
MDLKVGVVLAVQVFSSAASDATHARLGSAWPEQTSFAISMALEAFLIGKSAALA